ncbi:MAG: 4-hydroxy-tetrahydrodipicolinate reductase [Candidatus Krumholzibacteriia bacterium]
MSHVLVVNGAAGRMGRLVARELRRTGFTDLAGCDPGAGGSLVLDDMPLVEDLVRGIEPGGVVVDFSHASATPALCRAAAARQARLVVGTTGQSVEELRMLEAAAGRVPVVLARNFSLGINRLAQVLPKLRVLTSEGFDVECVEAHHRQKRDAPSGTAQLLLEALFGSDPPKPVHGRFGSEALREAGEVGVHSLRLGQLPGEHTLLLASEHEVLEIRHRALDRSAFVSGVAPAVRFVQSHPAGLYSMLDVIADAP